MNKKRMKLIKLAAALASVVPLAANALTIDGKDWRQVNETVGVSWSQVAGVCNTTTGACNGGVGSVLFNGWTWASVDDVRALFDHLILPETIQFPTSQSDWGEFYGDNIGSLIGESMFLNTYLHSQGVSEGVYGLTRSLYKDGNNEYALRPYLQNYFLDGAGDVAGLFSFAGKNSTADWMGVWLYKDALPVPEPETYAMMLAGLALVGAMARRRKLAQV